MIILPEQIRAARAILGWTAEELAKRAGMTHRALQNIETGFSQARAANMERIKTVIEQAGLEFTADCGIKKRGLMTVFDGRDAYLRMMQDAEFTVSAGDHREVLFAYVTDAMATTDVIAQELKMRGAGIGMRCLIKATDTYIRYPLREYRLIPDEFWHHNSEVIYGDKVAIVINMGERILIINDHSYATARRLNFEHYWRQLRSPTKTTAGETYE